jgi:hypothetical protein
MWSVDVLDPRRRIIKIVWSGLLKAEEIKAANVKLDACIRQLGSQPFDVLVDMREAPVFPPEAQKELVEHQRWLLGEGMQRAAVVTAGAIAEMQLDRTRRQSGHEQEFNFSTPEEALTFLAA